MNIIQWSKTALKQIVKIDRRYQKAIKDKVQELADFPDAYLNLKKLKGSENE